MLVCQWPAGVQALTLGSLDDLRKATKGGQDPDPERKHNEAQLVTLHDFLFKSTAGDAA
jgi:hypothetical protein